MVEDGSGRKLVVVLVQSLSLFFSLQFIYQEGRKAPWGFAASKNMLGL